MGELAGVTGNTIGQWARWGYIRASQSDGDPHVYSVEDVTEAAMVHALLERGVSHTQVRRAIAHLSEYGDWPLSEAPLAVTDGPRPRIVLREGERRLRAVAARLAADGRAAAAGGRSPAAQEILTVGGSVGRDGPPPAPHRRAVRRARRARLRGGGPRPARRATPTCGSLEGFMGLWAIPGASYASAFVGLFNPLPFALLSRSLVLACAVAIGRPRAGAAAFVTMLGAGVTTQLLKPLLAVQRDFPAVALHGPGGVPERPHDRGHELRAGAGDRRPAAAAPARRRGRRAAHGRAPSSRS